MKQEQKQGKGWRMRQLYLEDISVIFGLLILLFSVLFLVDEIRFRAVLLLILAFGICMDSMLFLMARAKERKIASLAVLVLVIIQVVFFCFFLITG